MSDNADFIFNVPLQFQAPADFVQWLNNELGLALQVAHDGASWDGPHLGLVLHFTPRHHMDAEPTLPYDAYQASIGLTGYAGHGDLRVILLSAVMNIALALCARLQLDGIVIWNHQVRIAHLGVKGKHAGLWDVDRQTPITSFADLQPLITHGVQY